MTHGDDHGDLPQSASKLTDFKDVGQALKRRREELGLTIDDVMQSTKLGRRTLELLEQGDLKELPHPVYIKGFIKAYMVVLNMELDELLPGLDAVLDTGRESEQPVKVKVSRTLPDVHRSSIRLPSANRLKVVGIVLVLLLLAAGGFIWYSLSQEDPSVDNATLLPRSENMTSEAIVERTLEEAPSVAESAEEAMQHQNGTLIQDPVAISTFDGSENATTGTPEAPDSPETPANATDANATAPPSAPETAAGETNGSGSPLDAVDSTNALGDAGDATPAVTLDSPAGSAQTLIVRATEQCWVGLTLDLETAMDFYLYPKQHALIRFQDTVTLRLGNAGGVTFEHNGKAVPTNFEKGVVKTITFPPGN